MAKVKFLIVKVDDSVVLARAASDGKDKDIQLFGNVPQDLMPGTIVICNGKWKFDSKSGFHFVSDNYEIKRKGIGSTLKIVCTINTRAIKRDGFEILINGVSFGYHKITSDGFMIEVPLCEGTNKMEFARGRDYDTLRLPPLQPHNSYIVQISISLFAAKYVVTDKDGQLIKNDSASTLSLIFAAIIPLWGLLYGIRNIMIGHRIAAKLTFAITFLALYCWIMVSAAILGPYTPPILYALAGPGMFLL